MAASMDEIKTFALEPINFVIPRWALFLALSYFLTWTKSQVVTFQIECIKA